jgi:DNA-binding CsgD family transcriptional regulator
MQGLAPGSDLAAAAQAAALDPAAWGGVVTALGAAHPGTRFLMVGTENVAGSSVPHVHLGYSPDAADSYVAHFQHLNPWWPPWRALGVGEIGRSEAVFDETRLVRGEFYNDWLRPQEELVAGIGTALLRDPARAFYLAGNLRRCDRDAGAGESVARTIAGAVPVIRHALQVNRMLLGLRIEAALGMAGAAPQAGAAILLLAGDGRCLHANGPAAALIDRGDGLRIDHAGRLRLAEAGADAGLHRCLHRRPAARHVQRLAGPPAREVRLVAVTDAMATRLSPGPLDGVAGRMWVAVAAPLAVAPPDPVQVVRDGLGLTRAEAEVALDLSQGQTPREIADARGRSLVTVRNQIKAAMSRVEAGRQADLVLRVDRLLRP